MTIEAGSWHAGTDAPGYSISESLFEAGSMVQVLEAIACEGLPRKKAGTRNALSVPAVQTLAADRLLLELAASFIGPHPIPFRATLFDKSPGSNWLVTWHQDTALPVRSRVETATWGPWSMKGGVLHGIAPAAVLTKVVALRVHLDDSTDANGPLRVLPGSDRSGVLTHHEVQRLAGLIPSVSCTSQAGGVVAIRPLLVHASSKATNDQPRRVLHIEYASALQHDGVELLVCNERS